MAINQTQINKIFQTWAKINPNPKCELNYSNNFELLIAVMLSAQATDKGVNKATAELFLAANSPKKMIDLGENEIQKLIKTIGLYRNKASNVYATSVILANQYNSQVPDTREELQKLPGVGRKTANVVLNTLFNQPTIAVDTHVSRVSQRIGMANTKTPDSIEQELYKIIPNKFQMHAHHWLILHGRYICKAQKPLCGSCPIFKYCNFENKSL